MSVAIEFQLTERDDDDTIKATVKYVRRRYSPQRSRSRKFMIGWIVAAVFFTILISILAHHSAWSPTTTAPKNSSDDENGSSPRGNPYAPWVLIFGVVFYFTFSWIRRRPRVTGTPNPPDTVYSMTADENGLIWTGPKMKTDYIWQAFDGFDETDSLFVIYQGEGPEVRAIQVLTVPKRAFSSAEMLTEFSQLLRANVEHRKAGG